MFCCTHLYLPKHPWVENYNYNSFTPVPYTPKADAACILLWIYSTIFSSFQFKFGLSEMKQKLGCLPHRKSPTRSASNRGTHLCNTYMRQKEEKAAASLSCQCHNSVGPQADLCTHIPCSQPKSFTRSCWTLSLEFGWRYWFESSNCFHIWLYFTDPEPHQLLYLYQQVHSLSLILHTASYCFQPSS